MPLALVSFFIFGVVIGSFLNVVAIRFKTGTGIRGRSKCMSCGKTLTWKELIPIISFLIQKGSCKKCKSRISRQYPLVEFLTGSLFVLIFLTFPPLSVGAGIVALGHMVIASVLMVICIYDVKHKVIPDSLVAVFCVLALALLFVSGSGEGFLWRIPGFWELIAGPLLATPFALIWLLSRGTWMGLGDAKLMVGIGWVLGMSAGINAMVLAFWIAAAASLAWMFVMRKRFKPRMEVPFGPYLVVGMYIVLFFGVQVIDIPMLKELLWGIM